VIRDIVASLLLIAFGCILLLHFVLIWIYGTVRVYENSTIILAVETILALGIMVFGVERFFHHRNRAR
jgi:hypothetical protein